MSWLMNAVESASKLGEEFAAVANEVSADPSCFMAFVLQSVCKGESAREVRSLSLSCPPRLLALLPTDGEVAPLGCLRWFQLVWQMASYHPVLPPKVISQHPKAAPNAEVAWCNGSRVSCVCPVLSTARTCPGTVCVSCSNAKWVDPNLFCAFSDT